MTQIVLDLWGFGRVYDTERDLGYNDEYILPVRPQLADIVRQVEGLDERDPPLLTLLVFKPTGKIFNNLPVYEYVGTKRF